MANIAAVECADEICCHITGINKPFSGIPFIGLGDFHQVAPVVKGQGSTPTVLASIKSLYLWPQFSIHSLHHPYRSAQDPEYTDFIDQIGEDYEHHHTSVGIVSRIETIDEAVSFLYPPDILCDPPKCLKRALLSLKNMYVDEFNNHVLDILPGEPGACCLELISETILTAAIVVYYSADIVKENDEIVVDHPEATPDYLAMLTHNGIPFYELKLKEGCICSLMCNMSVSVATVATDVFQIN
jgi:PIF1-like helicase